jgi:hypothetical protein
MDCGCGVAHGDPTHANHLMVENLKQMAEADGISVSQVLANINESAAKDRAEHPAEWA